MKIIAGKYHGRTLSRPKTDRTRPMSDKVREALFNLIGPIEGFRVIDAYAGSGAVGIEALSRGAAEAVVIESARETLKAILDSKKKLSLGEELTIIAQPVAKALPKLPEGSADLVVADPPYDNNDAQELAGLGALLRPEGLMVVSHSSRIEPPQLESMERIDNRQYGDSSLSFYRRTSS